MSDWNPPYTNLVEEAAAQHQWLDDHPDSVPPWLADEEPVPVYAAPVDAAPAPELRTCPGCGVQATKCHVEVCFGKCSKCGRGPSTRDHRALCNGPPEPPPIDVPDDPAAQRRVDRKNLYRWEPTHCTACKLVIGEGCACERAPWSGSLEVRVAYRITSPRDSEDRMVRSRRRKDERRAMARALHPFAPPNVAGKAPGAVVVTFTRYGMRPLDTDTVQYAFKSLRDQVAVWLGCKDAPTDPPEWRYEQVAHVQKEPDTRRGRAGHERFEIYTMVRIEMPGSAI
ncbi:MAG: hypothetical protein ACLP1X_18635 [Polyangiaceae bacterium]